MRDMIARLATVIVACMLVSVALVVALGFAMVGVYFLFAQIASPAWAAFDSALAAIVFSLLVAGIALLAVRRPRRLRRQRAASNPNYVAAMVGDMLGSRFRQLTAQNTRTSILASFAAGFAVGLSPRLRAFLFNLIR
jgi:hypothetical protein